MEISTVFKIDDGSEERLERARICAKELSGVECSWHKKAAMVSVASVKDGELKWSIEDCCCEGLGQEIAKAIEDVTPKL